VFELHRNRVGGTGCRHDTLARNHSPIGDIRDGRPRFSNHPFGYLPLRKRLAQPQARSLPQALTLDAVQCYSLRIYPHAALVPEAGCVEQAVFPSSGRWP